MITTRQINVILEKGRKKFEQVTTKDIDASIKVEQPTGKVAKTPVISVSTTNIADVSDIAEKKRRDEIMAEKGTFQKGDAVYQNEKGELVIKEKPEKTIEKFAEEAGAKIAKMEDEKKLAVKKRMAKVRAAKKGKKK